MKNLIIICQMVSVVFLSDSAFAKSIKTHPKNNRLPASFPSGKVQVGGSEDADACGGTGRINATTNIFIYENGERKMEKIFVDQIAYSCGEKNGYIGIVFGSPDQNCGVSLPINPREDYKGPCKSGWIRKKFFESLAG